MFRWVASRRPNVSAVAVLVIMTVAFLIVCGVIFSFAEGGAD